MDKKRESRFFIRDKKDSFLLGKETWERKMKNKKGLELTINVMVLIILAVLVLVGLIIILERQTGMFSDFLNNLMGKTNVDAIVTSCNSLVASNSVYEYCCVERKVKYNLGGKIAEETLTCKEIAEKSFAGGINKLNCEGVC